MPPHFSRDSSYQTANLSDDSIDGLEPPPHSAGNGYGSRRGRGDGGMSGSEGEEEAEYPTRIHSNPSSRSARYSNPFSDAAASSVSEDEWAAPTAAKKQSSSGRKGSSRYGASGYDDEEQVLRSVGHHRRGESEGEGDEEEGGGGGGHYHKTRTAKKALKVVKGFAIGQVTKRVKLVCLLVVALLVLVGIMVGIVWYKKHQD